MKANKDSNLCPTPDLGERMAGIAIPGLVKQDGCDGMLSQHIAHLKAVLHEISDPACIEHIALCFKGARSNYFDVRRSQGKHRVHPFLDG